MPSKRPYATMPHNSPAKSPTRRPTPRATPARKAKTSSTRTPAPTTSPTFPSPPRRNKNPTACCATPSSAPAWSKMRNSATMHWPNAHSADSFETIRISTDCRKPTTSFSSSRAAEGNRRRPTNIVPSWPVLIRTTCSPAPLRTPISNATRAMVASSRTPSMQPPMRPISTGRTTKWRAISPARRRPTPKGSTARNSSSSTPSPASGRRRATPSLPSFPRWPKISPRAMWPKWRP